MRVLLPIIFAAFYFAVVDGTMSADIDDPLYVETEAPPAVATSAAVVVSSPPPPLQLDAACAAPLVDTAAVTALLKTVKRLVERTRGSEVRVRDILDVPSVRQFVGCDAFFADDDAGALDACVRALRDAAQSGGLTALATRFARDAAVGRSLAGAAAAASERAFGRSMLCTAALPHLAHCDDIVQGVLGTALVLAALTLLGCCACFAAQQSYLDEALRLNAALKILDSAIREKRRYAALVALLGSVALIVLLWGTYTVLLPSIGVYFFQPEAAAPTTAVGRAFAGAQNGLKRALSSAPFVNEIIIAIRLGLLCFVFGIGMLALHCTGVLRLARTLFARFTRDFYFAVNGDANDKHTRAELLAEMDRLRQLAVDDLGGEETKTLAEAKVHPKWNHTKDKAASDVAQLVKRASIHGRSIAASASERVESDATSGVANANEFERQTSHRLTDSARVTARVGGRIALGAATGTAPLLVAGSMLGDIGRATAASAFSRPQLGERQRDPWPQERSSDGDTPLLLERSASGAASGQHSSDDAELMQDLQDLKMLRDVRRASQRCVSRELEKGGLSGGASAK